MRLIREFFQIWISKVTLKQPWPRPHAVTTVYTVAGRVALPVCVCGECRGGVRFDSFPGSALYITPRSVTVLFSDLLIIRADYFPTRGEGEYRNIYQHSMPFPFVLMYHSRQMIIKPHPLQHGVTSGTPSVDSKLCRITAHFIY